VGVGVGVGEGEGEGESLCGCSYVALCMLYDRLLIMA